MGKKIIQLPEALSTQDDDLVFVSQGGVSKKIKRLNFGVGSPGPSGITFTVSTKTGNYTISAAGEVILADATNGGFTITLPTAINNSGFKATVKKIDFTANIITIAAAPQEAIDSQNTKIITIPMQSLDFISNGANWNLI